jgi:hypothetical protein
MLQNWDRQQNSKVYDSAAAAPKPAANLANYTTMKLGVSCKLEFSKEKGGRIVHHLRYANGRRTFVLYCAAALLEMDLELCTVN